MDGGTYKWRNKDRSTMDDIDGSWGETGRMR